MNNKTDIEEDIKILKDLKDKKIHFNASYFTTGTVQLDEKERQAIENILADRERLEKENKQLRINEINSLCEEYSELAKAANWTKEDTNRVITEYREMEVKANKYDSLVEKINQRIDELKEKNKLMNARKYLEVFNLLKYEISVLQELLDTNDRDKRRLEELE